MQLMPRRNRRCMWRSLSALKRARKIETCRIEAVCMRIWATTWTLTTRLRVTNTRPIGSMRGLAQLRRRRTKTRCRIGINGTKRKTLTCITSVRSSSSAFRRSSLGSSGDISHKVASSAAPPLLESSIKSIRRIVGPGTLLSTSTTGR